MKGYSIGDKIQLNHSFLKSIGANMDIASMKGIVTEIKTYSNKQFYRVVWDNENESHLVFSGNVCRIGRDSTE